MRGRAVGALIGVLGATLVPSTATAQSVDPTGPIDCPAVRAVDDVVAGDTGVGFTVSRGTTPDPFAVEVVDVLEDAIAPGLPLIVVEVDSPEIDRVGGIWAGMSGSPVYVGGELIGAIAYGFSFGPSKLGGVTPAAAMLDATARPTRPLPAGPDEVEMSATVQRQAVTEYATTSGQARSMSPLQVPVRASGPVGDKFDRGVRAFEAAYRGAAVVRGASGASSTSTPIEVGAGDNLAVSLSYGDVGFIGTGTATTACEGSVVGFGHPLLYAGATRLGLHGASAVRVVDDGVFGPYKLANAGAPVGTIDQDRLAAVAGRLGTLPPTTTITTSITTPEGRVVDGRTDVPFPDDLFSFVLFHGWTNFDLKALDDPYFQGTSEVSWTVRGSRSDGRPFEVTHDDRQADIADLSTATVVGASLAAQQLLDNPYEEVRITEVELTAEVEDRYAAYQILGDRITTTGEDGERQRLRDGVAVTPGTSLELQVPLRRYRAEERTVEVVLEVPPDASGFAELVVSGGGGGTDDPFECLFFPEECSDDFTDDFDGLLDELSTAPRGDELIVELTAYDEFTGIGRPIAAATIQLDEVVTGTAYHGLELVDGDGGWGPPHGDACSEVMPVVFDDVDAGSAHLDAIGCAAALDLVRGVATSPPRFAPARAVTRGHAAAVLARLLDHVGVALPTGSAARFTDVVDSVHADDIERLAAAGIVRGHAADRYAPQEPVTRAQLASLLTRTLAYVSRSPVNPFGGPYHADAVGPHAEAMAVVHERELMLGRRDGTFGPQLHTRRDQLATVAIRLLAELSQGHDDIYEDEP